MVHYLFLPWNLPWIILVCYGNQQQQQQTSKFHGEFMSPALFLFEVLKMVKLTRGPLVLYQLPKYWSRKPVIKNNFKILKKPHAYLQTILKAPVKFQISKDRLKTVVGVMGSRYLLPIRFCSIRTKKMSVKNAEKVVKNYFRILKNSTCISSGHPKSPCKVSKGSDKNCGKS